MWVDYSFDGIYIGVMEDGRGDSWVFMFCVGIVGMFELLDTWDKGVVREGG